MRAPALAFALVLLGSACSAGNTAPATAFVGDRSPDSSAAPGEPEAQQALPPGMVLVQGPAKRAEIAPFWLDRTEVTVDAYTACVQSGRCTAPVVGSPCTYGAAGRGQFPVTCSTWEQAAQYCGTLGKRLPTQEEWEYAARRTGRAGAQQGHGTTPGQGCWHRSESDGPCAAATSPLDVSAFGVLDMMGDVREMTSTVYCGVEGCLEGFYTYCGGDWQTDDPARQSDCDAFTGSSGYFNYLGFRCAKSVEPAVKDLGRSASPDPAPAGPPAGTQKESAPAETGRR